MPQNLAVVYGSRFLTLAVWELDYKCDEPLESPMVQNI